MPRVQVQDPSAPRRLSPSARPLDTFVQPFVERPSDNNELLQLAGALSDLQPSLRRWAAITEKADTEAQIKQAAADRLKNKLSFAEAVSKGLVPAGANPHYVREYKRMDGELDAQDRYTSFLSERWQKSGLYERDFPTERHAAEAYMEFVENARGEFLSDTFGDGPADPAYIEGFNARRGGIESAVGNRQVAARLARNEEKFTANTSALVGELLDSDVENVGQRIADLGKKQQAEFGISHDKFNALVLEQVVANAMNAALEGRYEDAVNGLDALDEIPTSPGNVLGRTGAAKEARNAARLKITQLQQQNDSYAWSKQSREWAMEDRPAALAARNFQAKQRERTLQDWAKADADNRESDERDLAYMDTMFEIIGNPTQDFTKRWSELAEKPHTASIVPSLMSALDARINSSERVHEDEGQLAQLRLDIMRGDASPETVVKMVADRTLSFAHGGEMLEDWRRVSQNAETLANQDRAVRSLVDDGRSGLSKSITGSDQFSSPATNQLAFQAQLEYDDLMADFLSTNPNATLREIRRERAEIVKLLLSDPQYSSETLGEQDERPNIRTPSEARGARTDALTKNPLDNPDMVE